LRVSHRPDRHDFPAMVALMEGLASMTFVVPSADFQQNRLCPCPSFSLVYAPRPEAEVASTRESLSRANVINDRLNKIHVVDARVGEEDQF